jgi:uncharacterized membrane protein YhaH (DUF805 family)
MFKHPFSFEGRIRRTEYGISMIVYMICAFIGGFLSEKIGGIGGIILLPCVWFVLAQGAKRAHDLGNSGWYILIPFYGLWLLFVDSQEGSNEYGHNPKTGGFDLDEVDSIGNNEA